MSARGGVLNSGPVAHTHPVSVGDALRRHRWERERDIRHCGRDNRSTRTGHRPPQKINRSGEAQNHGHPGGVGTYNLNAVGFAHTHTVNIGAHPGPGSFDRNNIPASTALAFAIRVE